MIDKKTWQHLYERMEALGIKEKELIEKFILGSGKGGQKVNTSASAVDLTHTPSKIRIKCHQERSRELNRLMARRLLCEKLEEKIEGKKSAKAKAAHKTRKQKQKRSKRAKEKMLESKKKRSEIKGLRTPPDVDN